MASLSGTQIRNTYSGILKTSDSAGVTGTLKTVSDGTGADTALQISSTAVRAAKLEITSAPTSSINTVLVWDSHTKEILSRTLPTFESITATTAATTNGGSITIADAGGSTSIIGFEDASNIAASTGNPQNPALDIAYESSSNLFRFTATGIRPAQGAITTAIAPTTLRGDVFSFDLSNSVHHGLLSNGKILTLPLATKGLHCVIMLEKTPHAQVHIKTSGSAKFWGSVKIYATSEASTTVISSTRAMTGAAGGDTLFLTPNGTDSGGAQGSNITITCNYDGYWHLNAELFSTGVPANAGDTWSN